MWFQKTSLLHLRHDSDPLCEEDISIRGRRNYFECHISVNAMSIPCQTHHSNWPRDSSSTAPETFDKKLHLSCLSSSCPCLCPFPLVFVRFENGVNKADFFLNFLLFFFPSNLGNGLRYGRTLSTHQFTVQKFDYAPNATYGKYWKGA